MQLAVSHAQLSLRDEVGVCDAILAILMYEETMTFKSGGHSPLTLKPLIHIEDNDIQRYIGSQRDEYMTQFHKQLVTFIADHASSVASLCEEE